MKIPSARKRIPPPWAVTTPTVMVAALTFMGLSEIGWAEPAQGWRPEIDFTAEVQRTLASAPDRSSQGKMYVSVHGIRTEGMLNGKKVVMIFHPTSKEAWMLLPEQKQYLHHVNMEMRRPPLPNEADSPCRTQSNYQCQLRSTEKLDGRTIQRWEIRVTAGGKETSRATLWVDPRLQLAVKEEYSDGLTVVLRGIREEPQPRELFLLPEGYQEMAPVAERPKEGALPAPGGRPPPSVQPPSGRGPYPSR